MRKTYYLEVTNANEDAPYVIQTEEMNTERQCLNLYKKAFSFLESNYSVYLMAMVWINDDEYEVEQVRTLKKSGGR